MIVHQMDENNKWQEWQNIHLISNDVIQQNAERN